jgi:hypothetical protein
MSWYMDYSSVLLAIFPAPLLHDSQTSNKSISYYQGPRLLRFMHNTKYTVFHFSTHTKRFIGPILRLGPDKIDVQPPEVVYQGWGGQNDTKRVWDKDPVVSAGARFGFNADNILSTSNSRDALQIRRLVGPPYAKKFLLDQEWIFKDCTKRMIERLNQLRETNDNKVDLVTEYKNYAMDVVSMT